MYKIVTATEGEKKKKKRARRGSRGLPGKWREHANRLGWRPA